MQHFTIAIDGPAGAGKSRSEQTEYGIAVKDLSTAPSEHLETGRIRRGHWR